MDFINNWLRSDILAINSYFVPNSTGKLKLDAMESPFLLDEKTNQELAKKLSKVHFNRYPHNHQNLHKVIKDLMDIPDDLEILLGNGSDELIQLLMLGCDFDDKILGMSPSFVMYEMIAKWCKLNYLSIDLDSNFEIKEREVLQNIKQNNPKIIFISQPNNPTGNNFKRSSIEKIINSTKNMVVVDEAYYAYSDNNFIPDIQKYDNLVVLRTISKIGFAGLRLGVMIGSKQTINELNKLRMPYNINSLTMCACEFLLTNKSLIVKNATIIKQQRAVVFETLNNIDAIVAFKSNANFILFKLANADKLFDYLTLNNILIKKMSGAMSNYLRVTIGNKNENKQFLQLVSKFYNL